MRGPVRFGILCKRRKGGKWLVWEMGFFSSKKKTGKTQALSNGWVKWGE
jgi:hypothetical protein